MALLPLKNIFVDIIIYNSRNSNGFIANETDNRKAYIYNSRNSNGFIAT